MEYPITWTFVWQGALTEEEALAFADKQPGRTPLYDGGLWLEADPERCANEGHVPRLHPDESWQSYCVICGEYPVVNQPLIDAIKKLGEKGTALLPGTVHECITAGTHLVACDDDGYCNACGYQEGG